jgi:hypothetical protein
MSSTRNHLNHLDAIAQVERRIELRRARMFRHFTEAQNALRERAKPLPLLGIAAVGIAAAFLGRGQAPPTTRRAAGVAAKSGLAAALIGLLQTILRLGTSPLVRAGWTYARRRAEGQPSV